MKPGARPRKSALVTPLITPGEAAELTAHNAREVLQEATPNPKPALEAAAQYGGIVADDGDGEDWIEVLRELVAKERLTVDGTSRSV